MHKIVQNVFQKLGLSFLNTYVRFEPKLRRINVRKLKFSSFLIKRLDYKMINIFIAPSNCVCEGKLFSRYLPICLSIYPVVCQS